MILARSRLKNDPRAMHMRVGAPRLCRRQRLLFRFVRAYARSLQVRTYYFRAVALVEWLDIQTSRRLRRGGSGMEGKHVWTCAEHALSFGRMLRTMGWSSSDEEFYVIRVTLPRHVKLDLIHANLDQIGPGYFLREDQLQFILNIHQVCRDDP